MKYNELLHTGTVISCRIEGKFIGHAVIYRDGDTIWICQNLKSGADDAEKNFGKKYSWQTNVDDPSDDDVTDIVIKSQVKGKSKGSSTVEITYTVGGVDYTKNEVDGVPIKDIQRIINQFDEDIKNDLKNIEDLRAAKAEEMKKLERHAKFAARGWTLK